MGHNLDHQHLDELFRLAVEAAATGILMIGRNGRITLVNGQTEKIFGYNRQELVGHLLCGRAALPAGRFMAPTPAGGCLQLGTYPDDQEWVVGDTGIEHGQ